MARAFGNVTNVKEAAADVWRFESFIGNVASDVRYALRALIHKPGYTIAVVLTLALGIGANAVVFALLNAVVLRPLPYPDPDRLISVSQMEDGRDIRQLHDVAYAEWVQSTKTLELSAAYKETDAVLTTPDGPAEVTGLRATRSYFSIFGVKPLMGRTFDENESNSAASVVILSEQLWRDRFGADLGVLGRSAHFDGTPRLIIGVLPASFTYGRSEEFWIPLRVAPVRVASGAGGEELFGYSVVARLRENVSLAAARTELATVLTRLAPEEPGFGDRTPVVMTLHQRRHGEMRVPLLLLFGAVGVLLLAACANIANLALARAARREREFSLRLALGASRWRIVRFVLIENLALAAGGAALGLLLVSVSLGWFVRISPGSIRNIESIGVSGTLIAYASVVAIITGLLFGLLPALTASRATLNGTLAIGTQHVAGSRRQLFTRRALVIGELAIALVFLTGAGLVAKTFWRAMSADPGFRPERLLVATIELRANRYADATATAFFTDLMARVRREPGVQSVAYAQYAPMSKGAQIVITCVAPCGADQPETKFSLVGVDPEYFQTVGARLVAGRLIGADDRAGAPRVAVVSESYVRENLSGAPAIGRMIAGEQMIVGVVEDIAQRATDGEHYPLVFVPLAQSRENKRLEMIVRTTGQPEQLETPIRQAVQALDPAQPPPTFKTIERALAEHVAPRRFTVVLLASFAMLAGGLAVIGLYSVLAYLVHERTREIGIRIAVGANPGRVTRMVLGHALRLTVIGVVLGGFVSVAAVRVLRAWMYEMSVYDVPTFVAVTALLSAVALLASWMPARRASRVDPVLALRAD